MPTNHARSIIQEPLAEDVEVAAANESLTKPQQATARERSRSMSNASGAPCLSLVVRAMTVLVGVLPEA